MDQAVNAGITIIRTWGFRDLNVTYIPSGVSGKSFSFGIFAESELSAITASSVWGGGCRFLYNLLPKLGEWCRDDQ
jgi:hypothetical protein